MRLTRTDDLAAEVAALAMRHGGRVGLAAVLVDLDRRLRPTVAWCLSRHRAWTWDAADRRDRRWWPQGVSPAPGGRFVAVSWYAGDGGSRVSFCDLRRRRYRHVELVRPTSAGHEPLRVHAGGLAWVGQRLYIAATGAGLWVADTGDVVRAGAAYLLPVRHRLAPTEPFRFSFVSGDDEGLLAGEYGRGGQSRRLVRITEHPATVVDHGVAGAQGVVLADGTYHLTASHGPWLPGSLWTGQPGSLRERRYAVPMGPEDLGYDAPTRRLWTVTEHPNRRWLLSWSAG